MLGFLVDGKHIGKEKIAAFSIAPHLSASAIPPLARPEKACYNKTRAPKRLRAKKAGTAVERNVPALFFWIFELEF